MLRGDMAAGCRLKGLPERNRETEDEKMGDRNRQKTLVLGHRNPDTDSICSAICYANLKEKMTGEEYEPCRAGNLNPETQFVLKYYKLWEHR